MKKLAFLILFSIASLQVANAQHILSSSILYENEVHPSSYIFIPSESKKLENEWKTYLSKVGKVSESKGQVTVNVQSSDISRQLDRVISYIQDYKSFSGVQLILLDDNGRSLAPDQINTSALERLLFDFYDLAYFNQEVSMAEEDLALSQKVYDDAEKSKSRAERNLANNLKAQEKLGKKLDATPEKLAELIQEKDDVYQQQLQNANDANSNDVIVPADETLAKEYTKTEKKLLKTKNTSERNASKLEKKEEEYTKLIEELLLARKDLMKAILIFESKKLVLQDLKTK
jgi:hypothetical protein